MFNVSASAIISKARKTLVLIATAAALTFSAGALTMSAPAMAAGKGKQVETGLRFSAKTFQALDRAGRKAQNARGIAKPVGGILRGVGRGGQKVSNGAAKIVGGIGRGKACNLGKGAVKFLAPL